MFGKSQQRTMLISFAALATSICAVGVAASSTGKRPVSHHILFSEYQPVNRLVELSPEGKILWEHPYPSLVVMIRAMPNGNVMYAYGGTPTGVQEVDRDHKVVWNYEAQCEQVLGFDNLPNGNVLVGEQGPCRAVEVNRKGEIVRTVDLQTQEKAAHRQLRSVHKLSNGNILACHEGDATVREYDSTGRVVWEYKGVQNVYEAVRLKNGRTLISNSGRVLEVDRDGKTTWELAASDVPDVVLTWPTSIEVRKNGNLVIADFKRDAQGKGAHAFEVTRDKKIVWTYADHNLVKILTYVHVID